MTEIDECVKITELTQSRCYSRNVQRHKDKGIGEMRLSINNTKQIMEAFLEIIATEERRRKWIEEAERLLSVREKTRKRNIERKEKEDKAKKFRASMDPYDTKKAENAGASNSREDVRASTSANPEYADGPLL